MSRSRRVVAEAGLARSTNLRKVLGDPDVSSKPAQAMRRSSIATVGGAPRSATPRSISIGSAPSSAT
jgi:hypothetical protein